MHKHLNDIKKDNDEKYWDNILKFNKNNAVFRNVFADFIEENEADFQERISKEMKKKIYA